MIAGRTIARGAQGDARLGATLGGHGTFALCNVKEGGIALCNEKASRPPRTQILVPPFFWRGFFFGPFSTTAKTSVQYLLELQRDWARTETYGATGLAKTFGGAYCLGVIYAKTMLGPHASTRPCLHPR
jgi:hypothetical protein